MSYSIELNFDPRTEAVVQECWRALAEKGVSDSMIQASARPHVSLSLAEQVIEDKFQNWLETFVVQLRPLDLLFQSVGCFPSTGVLFLTPTVTKDLLAVHQGFYDAQPMSWQKVQPYYLPERWVPHCTLAIDLSEETMPAALSIAIQTALPIAGKLTSLTLNEIQPGPTVRVVQTFDFRE